MTADRFSASAAPRLLRAFGQRFALVFAFALLAGCATLASRSPVPAEQLDVARPYGIDAPLLRFWGDRIDTGTMTKVQAEQAHRLRLRYAEPISSGEPVRIASLALSGGGPDGAFGAGVLTGWTERGDRPEFQLVTGVSTGAVIAVFAFLGPRHDATLREIFTTYRTANIGSPAILAGLLGGAAIADNGAYRAMIQRYVTTDVVAAIADAYARGRVLLIGTTNIDASRPVMWNLGAIASSGSPDAEGLIEDVIEASSAIPGVFPPVVIPVSGADGRLYDEMHVDGGATQQVMLYAPGLRSREADAALGVRLDQSVWVIVNNRLEKPYDPVPPGLVPIAAKAASSLISGSGGGDLYRIWAIAQRDGIALHVLAVPPEFKHEPAEPFDPVYMAALFATGREIGRTGRGWIGHPPDFAPDAPLAATPACGCASAAGSSHRATAVQALAAPPEPSSVEDHKR